MEYTNFSSIYCCSCFKCIYSSACCLTAYQLHILVIDIVIKASNSIASTTYASNNSIWKSSFIDTVPKSTFLFWTEMVRRRFS